MEQYSNSFKKHQKLQAWVSTKLIDKNHIEP